MILLRALALAPVVALGLGFLYLFVSFLVRTREGNLLAFIILFLAFTVSITLLGVALVHFGFTGIWEWFPSND